MILFLPFVLPTEYPYWNTNRFPPSLFNVGNRLNQIAVMSLYLISDILFGDSEKIIPAANNK